MSDFLEHSSKLGRGRSPRSEENREIFVFFPEGTQDAELVTAGQLKPQATGARRESLTPGRGRQPPQGMKNHVSCHPVGCRFFQKWKEEEKGRPGNKVSPREKHFGVSGDEVAL